MVTVLLVFSPFGKRNKENWLGWINGRINNENKCALLPNQVSKSFVELQIDKDFIVLDNKIIYINKKQLFISLYPKLHDSICYNFIVLLEFLWWKISRKGGLYNDLCRVLYFVSVEKLRRFFVISKDFLFNSFYLLLPTVTSS